MPLQHKYIYSAVFPSLDQSTRCRNVHIMGPGSYYTQLSPFARAEVSFGWGTHCIGQAFGVPEAELLGFWAGKYPSVLVFALLISQIKLPRTFFCVQVAAAHFGGDRGGGGLWKGGGQNQHPSLSTGQNIMPPCVPPEPPESYQSCTGPHSGLHASVYKCPSCFPSLHIYLGMFIWLICIRYLLGG